MSMAIPVLLAEQSRRLQASDAEYEANKDPYEEENDRNRKRENPGFLKRTLSRVQFKTEEKPQSKGYPSPDDPSSIAF